MSLFRQKSAISRGISPKKVAFFFLLSSLAQAGIHCDINPIFGIVFLWIPAFAGMTITLKAATYNNKGNPNKWLV
ncbi:MAG: hypothetical protein EBQ96_05680 [Proteobacteria bacterium]|nr:hypothetical protein [Pseudomonadota bacterium]